MTLKSLKRQCFFLLILAILLGGVLVQKSFASCSQKTLILDGGDCSCDGSCDCSVTWAQTYCEDPCSTESSSYCVKVGNKYCPSDGRPRVSYYVCTSQEQVDSLVCVNDGGTWQDGSCKAALDSTACDSYRQACEEIGGTFHGNLTELSETGCSSYCDMCSSEAQSNYRKAIAIICCKQGKVPPSSVTTCQNLDPISTMSWSIFDCDSRGGYDCECQKIDSSNVDTYQSICIDGEWEESSSSSGGSSSSDSGEGSSSSGEGDSSASESPYPEGCDECPWLDSILDTLTLVKDNTDDVLLCLQVPALCPALLGDTVGKFSVDSILLKYIEPLLDSTVKLDSSQIKILSKLDTNLIKMLRNDSTLQKLDSASLEKMDESLKNDSLTRSAINGGFSDVDSALHGIAKDLGISTDSVIAHLDSILKGIPDSVLDSIVKYQAYANESIDSAIYGTGKGFSLVDSLIDSTIKYFSRTIEYDSAWRETWADSTSKVFEYMRWQPGAINAALGYGDTASTTLRGDLNGIQGSLDGIGDALDGLGGGFDSIFAPGSYDVGDDPYADGESDGKLIADSVRDAIGFGDLDALDVDSLYDSALALAGSDVWADSVDSAQNSRFAHVLDSLNTELAASNDSMRDALPDSLDIWADSIRKYAPFAMFDSLIYGTFSDHIPNTNTCPEHCSKFQIELADIGITQLSIDYGLCLGRAPLGNMNVFAFIRMIARIVTVVSCLMLVYRNVTTRS